MAGTYSSVQFSCSVMSHSLWPYGLQHARLPCPPLSPRDCSISCPLSRWCHPIISSSVAPFSFPQSFPASGSFLMSWIFASDGQNNGASVSAAVLPVNIQGWFPLGLTGLISLTTILIYIPTCFLFGLNIFWSLLLLLSVFPSIKFFSSESALCIRWPNYWRFNFSNSPSSEYSELIS